MIFQALDEQSYIRNLQIQLNNLRIENERLLDKDLIIRAEKVAALQKVVNVEKEKVAVLQKNLILEEENLDLRRQIVILKRKSEVQDDQNQDLTSSGIIF